MDGSSQVLQFGHAAQGGRQAARDAVVGEGAAVRHGERREMRGWRLTVD